MYIALNNETVLDISKMELMEIGFDKAYNLYIREPSEFLNVSGVTLAFSEMQLKAIPRNYLFLSDVGVCWYYSRGGGRLNIWKGGQLYKGVKDNMGETCVYMQAVPYIDNMTGNLMIYELVSSSRFPFKHYGSVENISLHRLEKEFLM